MSLIIKNILYPFFSRRDGNPGLYNHLRALEESQYLPLQRIQEIQFQKLKALLRHAYDNTEFYRKRFDECGFKFDKMNDFNELRKIPILTKEDIRDNLQGLVARDFQPDELKESLSGGTTGLVTKFYLANSSLSAKQAAVLRFDKWTGWEVGDWMSLVWPATLEIHDEDNWRSGIKNYLSYRRIKLALTVIDEELIVQHVKRAIKRRATMIRAFPTPLVEVARYVLDKDITGFSLKGIVTTGEPLYPYQREMIERAFQCPVFDSYRTRENGPLAQECERHNGYHINAESVFLEIIPFSGGEKRWCEYPGQGRVLVTDLLNYGMPSFGMRSEILGQ